MNLMEKVDTFQKNVHTHVQWTVSLEHTWRRIISSYVLSERKKYKQSEIKENIMSRILTMSTQK